MSPAGTICPDPPASQERRFGHNNDFLGFIPLEYDGGQVARAILCVNHEYTNGELMFPGLGDAGRTLPPRPSVAAVTRRGA